MLEIHGKPPTPPEAQSTIDTVEQYLRQGEPLLAYNAVQDGLRAWPGNLRLRQLKGLAVARSGDIARANQLLCQLAAEGAADAETLGMLARTHKDLALRSRSAADRVSHLMAAFRIYTRAYEAACMSGAVADASYTGINAATIAVLQGDLAAARRIARDVRDLCIRAQGVSSAGTDYWLEATLGEAALILGDAAESAAHYAQASNLAPGRFGDLGITRRQAKLLAQLLPGGSAWISEVLKVPPVVMYTHTIMPRFTITSERATTEAIRKRFERLRPAAAYGSATYDSDILCLEAMRELGGETHIVLPFPAEELRRLRFDLRAGDWGRRFDRVLAAASSVTITSDHRARGSSATFEYANLVLTGMARLRARLLETDLRGFAISDDGPSAAPGSVPPLLQIWQSQNLDFEQVRVQGPRSDVPEPDAMTGAVLPEERLPAGFTHEIRAMMFADAVGYSALSEDQTPDFITQFLGAVADLNARTAQRPEHVETTGDGLYMVFGSVRDAGCYALQLNQLVSSIDWAARGLPGGLSIRIALHCGPVYCGRNPVTGAPLYTGPHTSRTARIEPITPPGQVYASSAFAAVAAAVGVDGLELQYVGRIPLAKDYGLLGLYHVRSVAERATGAAEEVAVSRDSAVSAGPCAAGAP
jgi:class 3 adenylate cyclase